MMPTQNHGFVLREDLTLTWNDFPYAAAKELNLRPGAAMDFSSGTSDLDHVLSTSGRHHPAL